MIYYDPKTARFRDSTTGLYRTDISALVSSAARKQLQKLFKTKSREKIWIKIEAKRALLGRKFSIGRKPVVVKFKNGTVVDKNIGLKKPKKFKDHPATNDFIDYLDEYLDEYDDLVLDEDTDLETP